MNRTEYCIAYCDTDGSDFGGLPFLKCGFGNIHDARRIGFELINGGFRNVTIFTRTDPDSIVTWAYVKHHKAK